LANGLEFGHKEDFMGGVNEFIVAERDSMRFFIDMLSNNWTTGKRRPSSSSSILVFVTHFVSLLATERVADLESEIETQVALIESLENMNLMYSVNFLFVTLLLFFLLFFFFFPLTLFSLSLWLQENQDVGTKKARAELQKNIELSRGKVAVMRAEVSKIRRMCPIDNQKS
jgi:hypothetical protein